ncbi:hypothetical protein [uncultured Roseobacter sp.]|uniref:hypothetical protein n=1 Tax=uncultured Roseobacter sp. TaxID=114847 RepID=UPI0026309772|nr:hypothetical protein [uncultured Roseobacter sp.]
MSDQQIEIYRQRYETFRHLDRLRWQMAQVLVAVLSAAALIFRTSPDGVGGAFWLFLGLAFLTIALVMNRISQGIEKNGEVLKAFGAAVGDDRIPSASSGWQSVTHWLTIVIAIGGAGCLIFGLSELRG